MGEEQLNDLSMNTYVKKNPVKRFKSYTVGTIFMLLIIACIVLTGQIGSDFFALLVFLLIVSIPVLMLFRTKLVNILPGFLSDSLLEIDEDKNDELKVRFKVLKIVKEGGIYATIMMLVILSFILILDFRTKLDDKKTFVKIFGGVLCLSLSGMLLIDLENLTL